MFPSTKDDLALLQHLVIGDHNNSQRTRREIKFLGQTPESVNSWRPGRIASTFSKLGFKVESSILSHGRDKFTGSKNETNTSTGRSKSEAEMIKPRHGTQEKTHKAKKLVGNFNPPRRFSPTKVPKDNSSASNGPSSVPAPSNNNVGLFSTHTSHHGRLYDNKDTKNGKHFDQKNDIQQSSNLHPQEPDKLNPFKTAHEQLVLNDRAHGIKRTLPSNSSNIHVSGLRKITKFDAPIKNQHTEQKPPEKPPVSENPEVCELMEHPLMKNIDPKMVETVLNEVFDTGTVDWDDIAGLDSVKSTIREIIIYPLLRPDIFNGLRGPPKGILLFGPPGTGKTMIGRLISTQSKSSFFNISASSLTSKWIGDGEKMVRALFATARVKQPAVIFIDEIDSILTQRSESEHESSRRLKTEILIQFDGCGTKNEDRILVVGVTNRPQELDEAARRRLTKRIYIPLPDPEAREQLVKCLLKNQKHNLTDSDFENIAQLTNGYSGADMATLCQEASYGPIRDVGVDIQNICADQVRPMELKDFIAAIKHVKASVDQNDLILYEDWDHKFGCR